jgi:uncharacterized protein YqhQ
MSSRPSAGTPTTELGTAIGPAPPARGGLQAPAAHAGVAGDAEAPGAGLPAVEVDHDGELIAERDAPVGGQAVLEGVMMRGVSHWAVAVRKPTEEQLAEHERTFQEPALGEIEVSTFPLTSALKRHRALRLPIVRGVVALWESLVVGFRALEVSANAQLAPEETSEDTADGAQEVEVKEIPRGVWMGTVVLALALAVVLFFLIPVGLTSLIKDQLGSSLLFWLVEGVVRTSIFLGYLVLLSRLRDMRRVLEYHGAEHKTISCFEAGLPLTPPNCKRFSRLHPRCGTSFLLLVMIVAIFVFAPIGLPAWYWLVLTRIVGVPVIAGVSFELIKLAGRNRRRRWVRALMWPGMKLQLLTTREPDLDELAVAISALQAVLAREAPGELSASDLVGVEVVA